MTVEPIHNDQVVGPRGIACVNSLCAQAVDKLIHIGASRFMVSAARVRRNLTAAAPVARPLATHRRQHFLLNNLSTPDVR
jgi:hypothetical protein